MIARITRQKIYPCGSRSRKVAWVWCYSVKVTGQPHPFSRGPGLQSTLSWLKRRFPEARIVKAWEDDR